MQHYLFYLHLYHICILTNFIKIIFFFLNFKKLFIFFFLPIDIFFNSFYFSSTFINVVLEHLLQPEYVQHHLL
ncbi:hypothetical protein Mgra_00005156 [Meloidogyne graminicola]|uniref:Uncharacterized protein n=1 Tax=Meloidogyne graminicola TaxID=189291 RepID=A0A8S9ZQF2_9BILA|nr:hypothetical protein Mgra_00005156 [Meloidogyne graminicola]